MKTYKIWLYRPACYIVQAETKKEAINKAKQNDKLKPYVGMKAEILEASELTDTEEDKELHFLAFRTGSIIK